MIPVCEPLLDGREREYMNLCLDTNWISSGGSFLDRFERGFAEYCGCRYGIATTSGTTALHLALVVLGIGPGDEVIIPDFTIAACAFAVLYTGATPIFVDCDPDTFNIDTRKIEDALSSRTRAIMPVHLYGRPCDMQHIAQIALKHDLFIVEDAAEAHGAEYRSRKVGGFGHIGCFSFYGNKLLTTGEGGMLVTNSEQYADHAKSLRNLAHSPDRRFLHSDVGFNYRMCLPAGTKILTNVIKKWKNQTGSGQSSKIIPIPIEKIFVGDEVLSFNEATGKKEIREVTGVSKLSDDDLVRLGFSNGNELVLTSNHPVYIHGRGWVESKNVYIGDTALQYNYLALHWRLSSLAKRGKKLEEISGKERSLRIRTNHSKRIKELRTDPRSGYNTSSIFNSSEMHKKHGDTLRKLCQIKNLYPPERRAKIGQYTKAMWANPKSKIRSIESVKQRGLSLSVAIKKRIQSDPEFAALLRKRGIKALKHVGRKPTNLEKDLISLLYSRLPDTYKYVGDGKFWIENANPDFINVNGYKKAIEIYSPYWKIRDYGSVLNYQRQRRLLFSKYGWDVMFIEASRKIENPNEVINNIISFTYNPNMVAVTVVSKKRVQDNQIVYNLDVYQNNNFFAYGILVHNTNIQAAIGVAQLENLDHHISARLAHAELYNSLLEGVPGLTLIHETRPEVKAVSWMYCLLARNEHLRYALMNYLAEKGIQTRTFFVPMHQQPMFKVPGGDAQYPVATDISRRGLYLPSGTVLTDEQIHYICGCIKEYIKRNGRW